MTFIRVLIVLFVYCLIPTIVTASTPATMNDYWTGNASWKFHTMIDRASSPFINSLHDSEGVQLVVHENKWYLFHRKPLPAAWCPGNTQFTMVLHISQDKGLSWGSEIPILTPTQGDPDECAATDGSFWHNTAQHTWYYLYQCADATIANGAPAWGSWGGCLATRNTDDPAGPFTHAPDNPVITSGEIWNQICDTGADDCVSIPGGPNQVNTEGTFDIFHFDGTYYWISFHGQEYALGVTDVRGYRGLAKTQDFRTYIAGNTADGVPSDAYIDLLDIQNWRETWFSPGPLGVGHGKILKENGYYYQFIEGFDTNLDCTNGQNWDVGLFRSNNLTHTTWEQFPFGNPLVYSNKSSGPQQACEPSYSGVFRDSDGTVYLHFTRRSPNESKYGIYFYKLVHNTNLLKNADFWMCREDNWQRIHGPTQSTNYVTYRFIENSSDGNCYMATNCGVGSAQCQKDTNNNLLQNIYQDVDVPSNLIGQQVAFGAKISSEGGNGNAIVNLFALNSVGGVIGSTGFSANTNTSYQQFQKIYTIPTGTVKFRFALYPNSTSTYRLDETYILPLIPGDVSVPPDSRVDISDILSISSSIAQLLSTIFDYNISISHFGQ